MQAFQFDWQTKTGEKVVGKTFLPKEQAKHVLIFIHGFGDYSGRYDHIAKQLSSQGWAVVCFDLLGHGDSEGKKGVVAHYEQYFQLLSELIGLVSQQLQPEGIFLVGHNLGGNIAANFLLEIPQSPLIKGLVLCAPWLMLAKEPGFWWRLSAQYLPFLRSRLIFSLKGIADSEQGRKDFLQDRKIHNQINYKTYTAITKRGLRLLVDQQVLNYPVLLLQDSYDQIVDPNAAIHFMEKKAQNDGTILRFDHHGHELFNSVHRKVILEKMHNWLLTKI